VASPASLRVFTSSISAVSNLGPFPLYGFHWSLATLFCGAFSPFFPLSFSCVQSYCGKWTNDVSLFRLLAFLSFSLLAARHFLWFFPSFSGSLPFFFLLHQCFDISALRESNGLHPPFSFLNPILRCVLFCLTEGVLQTHLSPPPRALVCTFLFFFLFLHDPFFFF